MSPPRKPARITCAAAPRTSRWAVSGRARLDSPSRKAKSGRRGGGGCSREHGDAPAHGAVQRAGEGSGVLHFHRNPLSSAKGPRNPRRGHSASSDSLISGNLFARRWRLGSSFDKPLDNLYKIVPEAYPCVCSSLEHTQDVFVQEAAYQKHSVLGL